MMKRRIALGCALLVCLAWLPAQAEVLRLYDSFAGDQLDRAKWITPDACPDDVALCVREVRHRHLHLAVSGAGATDSDEGVTFAESQVLFTNPDPIRTIRFGFMVTSFSALACPPRLPTDPPPNTEAAHPQLLLHGAFFNAGSGDPADDVIAYLMVERRTDDQDLPPGTLRVEGFTSRGETFSAHVDLGTLRVWEPAVATLRWHPETDSFAWHVVKAFTRPHLAEGTLAYGESDTTPPGEPFKSLGVRTFAPNCTDGPGSAAMHVVIDNVRVNNP